MELLNLISAEFYTFLLVFARMMAMFSIVPFFQSRSIPAQARIGLALFVTLLIFPLLPAVRLDTDNENILILYICRELMVGFALGLVGQLFASVISIAGELFDYPMGFSMAAVIDPQTGQSHPANSQFLSFLFLLFLLLINGHHMILMSLYKSFTILPLGKEVAAAGSMAFFAKLFSSMFLIGIKLSLPVLAAEFIVNIALGVMAKAVPQLDVFIMGYSLKIPLGMMIMMAMLPLFLVYATGMFGEHGRVYQHLEKMLMLLGKNPG